MTRLVAFGCSFTYGSKLLDCPADSKTPSAMSWPAILGRKLDCLVINKGIPGAGNLQILYEILNFKFEPDDIVVILWSNISRGTIFNNNGIVQYGVWLPNYSSWLGAQTHCHLFTMSWIYMHHAEIHLNNLNLKNCSYTIEQQEMIDNKPLFVNLTNFKDIKGIFRNMPDVCDDNLHPGPITHNTIASVVYKDISS